ETSVGKEMRWQVRSVPKNLPLQALAKWRVVQINLPLTPLTSSKQLQKPYLIRENSDRVK
ncbi:hypothetical protein P4U44_18385, partial [Alkalihalobacillus alcalophilus]|uniref:hypothetical protein n=1 Tax=Alkalihalobacillus alcalophilus TaxID=1445 RepID=UPI002E1CADCA|nr:hypothetical protein [Alkalihalobacillus alcalophilus]